jgi:serine/threonine protein kinase
MKKELLLKKNQLKHTKDEQYFLSKINSPWIVNLKASFQEGYYLYLIMEYLPGGDLMGLLMKRDTLPENEAKFYLCEMILAIECVVLCVIFTLIILPAQYRDPMVMIMSYPPNVIKRVEQLPQYAGCIKQKEKKHISKKIFGLFFFAEPVGRTLAVAR